MNRRCTGVHRPTTGAERRLFECKATSGTQRRTHSYNAPMISREPTIERLAQARRLLLEPAGLDELALQEALGCIGSHRVDDCDLYFQITRHEGWSLEEGIVKSGSFGIDQGVGVRAVAGEKTAFAYSDDISHAALLDAARTVRSIRSEERR